MEATNYFGIFVALVTLYAIPLGFVLTDPVIGRRERIIWVAATIWFSWGAAIVYFMVAPIWPSDEEATDGLKRQEPTFGDR